MSDNILVAVRVRPLIVREESDFASLHWQIGAEHTITQTDPATRKPISTPYKFDRVFGPYYGNEDVYVDVAEPIVESALHGFNGTIFAYGQTSSGKTFTMMGDKTNPGIIPLAIQNIFRSIENTPDREYLIRASYMEIYNENITDLLAGRDSRGKSLATREDTSGAVYVADLKEECINCEESLLALMRKGNKNRHVGVTNMNERSSRSHTIFRLILESRERSDEDGGEGAVTVSHLNLVDLAGSENASQSGATGERLKEGGYINRSLFMLGRVISQLSDGEQFINFRDSKLTRILQLSLGGNAKTAIFCTVTPAAVEQTHSTLRFASRAKSIKNKPVVNEVLSDTALMKRYAKEIKNLKSSLEKERNTDKAQEVEQVREMLDEQARRNQELVAKVNELKAKLVVSSHPRNYSKNCSDKKKKNRRETWAAPAAFRAQRASLGPVQLEPIKLDHEFLRPEVPRLIELRELPEVSSTDITSSSMESSFFSEGFGLGDTSMCLDIAEQSRLGKFEVSFPSPRPVSVKRRRRVQFELTSPLPTGTSDAECQTEEILLPKTNFLSSSYSFTPRKGGLESPKLSQTCRTPDTPAYILRARNQELRQKLDENQEWLSDWQKEIDDLRDYQKVEIKLLQESFDAKVADGSVDGTKLEEQWKDINNLRHSLQDAELLLLDANRALLQKSQDMLMLQEQLERVNEENLRSSSFEAEVLKLREERKELKKALEDKESRAKQLENDRQDFDMMMELALQKQKRLEKDLRRSLDDAWTEIAGYEGRNKEEVRSSKERVSLLEGELSQLRASSQKGQEAEQKINDLEHQLEEAHLKQQATKKEMEEQLLELQQMEAVFERMKEVESQVSCVETLESELSKAQDEVRFLSSDNIHLRETANELQVKLDKKDLEGGTGEIEALQEEVQCLHEKLEAAGSGGVFAVPRPLYGSVPREETSITSGEISRKLSETLLVLEESIFVSSTPRRGSISSLDEPLLQPQDLEIIKQQLLGLQEALVAQDQYQQQQQQKLDTLNAEATHERLYYSQVVAKVEEELITWKVQESFMGDYVIHSWNSQQLKTSKSGQLCSVKATQITKSDTFLKTEQSLQDTCDEVHVHTESGPKTQFKENHSAVKARFCHNNDVKVEAHCVTPQPSTEFQSLEHELHQAGMTSCGETFETSILNCPSDSPSQEIKQLKWQLELLKNENAVLSGQVKQFQGNLKKLKVNSLKKELAYTSEDEEVLYKQNETNLSESVYVTPQQSLADELRQAGMNLTLCNNAFETSILNQTLESSNQEIQQLKHQLGLLSQENCLLHEEVKQLKTSFDQVKDNRETEEKWNQSTSEKSQNVINKLEKELHSVLAERNSLELEMEKLQEKLSDKMILEEEMHSCRWQVNNLKQEKSDLEEELKLIQEDYEKVREKAGVSITDIGHIKECFEKETNQLSSKAESLLIPEVIANSKFSTDIVKNPVKTTEELEHGKKKNVTLEEKLDKLKEELNKLKENNVSEVREESSRKEEKEKYIETVRIIMEKVKDRTKELEEAREIPLLPQSEGEKLNLLIKELEDAKDTIASLKGKLGDTKCQRETHETTAVLMDMKDVILILNDLENIFKDKTLELEVKGMITSYEADKKPETESLKENTLSSDELKEKQKELENATEKIEILEKEKENQHKYFEEHLANIIAEKDGELEMMITNFSEKEEAFENREKEMEKMDMEMGEIRKTLVDKEVELQNLKRECTNLQTMVNDLQSDLIKKKEEYSVVEENHSQLQKELEHLKKEYENRIHEMKKTVSGYEEQLNNQTQDLRALSESYEEQKVLLFDSEDVNKHLKNKLEKELSEMVHVSRTETSTSLYESLDHHIIDQKLDELEQLRNENSSKIKECHQLRQTIDNLKIMLTKKEEKLNVLSAEHSEEISSFIDNLSKKEEVINNLEDVVKARNEEVVCMRSAVEAKDLKIKQQESDLKAAQQALDDKEREHQESLSQIEAQLSSRVLDLQGEIEHLTKLYEEVCSDRKNMALVIKTREEEIERLTSEHNTLNLKLENLEENYRCISKSLETKEAEIIQKENALSLLESEHQSLQEEIDVQNSKERDLTAQQESSNQETEKLVGIIEKYETEVSEKDEQMHLLKTEMENNRALFSKTYEEMTQKYEDIEGKLKKFLTLEEAFMKHGIKLSELQNLPNKLATAEGKLVTLQVELDAKINECNEGITRHINEKQELIAKLQHTEEEHKIVREKLDDIASQLLEKTIFVKKITAEHDSLKLELENIQENFTSVSLSFKSTEAELTQKISSLQLENEKLKELFVSNYHEEEISVKNTDESIKLTEKIETRMTEKDEQRESQIAKYDAEILGKEQAHNALMKAESKMSKDSKFEETDEAIEMTDAEIEHSCEGIAALRKKSLALEGEVMEYRRDARMIESLQEKLALQVDSEAKHDEEKQELCSKLIQTKKELNDVLEKLNQLEQDLQEKTIALTKKEEECSQLEAEMDDKVNNFKREKICKANVIEALTNTLEKAETELSETKLRFMESSESYSALSSQFSRDQPLKENIELQNTIKSLKEELLAKQGELAKREQECAELNAEMNEMMDYFKNQGRNYGEQYTLVTEKLESTEKELSETKTKLAEFSRQRENLLGDLSVSACDASKQLENEKADSSFLQEKKSLEKQLAATRFKAIQLEEINKELKERIEDTEQSRKTLEEELKVSIDTVDSLLERLGDQEKFNLVYQEEKQVLKKQINEYQNKMETFWQSAGDEKAALERIDELMQNVTHLKCELGTTRKNLEDLEEEHSKWKIEYIRLFEECEELKVHSAKEFLPQEQKNTLPSTVINYSSCTSRQNSTKVGRESKTAFEEVKQDQRDLSIEIPEKGKSTKSKLEFFRQSQGTVSAGEESHREHVRMKTDVAERKQEFGSSDYDSLESDVKGLKKEAEVLQDKGREGGAIPKTEKLIELQRKCRELQEENFTLKKAAGTKATDTSVTGENSSDLQERIVVAERQNNELRLKLRALNAPAEKQVVTLTEELNLANQKVTHLRNELRRVQNTRSMDSTICEIKASTSHHSKAEGEYDYSSGSGIVLELQVLGLENEIYHLKKEKQMTEREYKTMEQHLDHYKKKAQEWKENALKERKFGEKVKKELELLHSENSKYKTKVGESCSRIERQQFELGHQREVIEKLEKERQEQSHKQHSENSGALMESHRQVPLSSTKVTESVVGKGAGNSKDSKTRSSSSLSQLGALNVPLPTHSRTEKLPCGNPSIESLKNPAGKRPLWQSLNKENKDYSKYYLPPGTIRKEDENCKTQ